MLPHIIAAIEAERVRQKIPVKMFAYDIGVSRIAYYHHRMGKFFPTPAVLQKMLDRLGLTLLVVPRSEGRSH